jgi:protein SCO1/2
MNKKAVYGLAIAILLPLISYFIVKNYSKNALTLPRHYIYDTVLNKTVDGKSIPILFGTSFRILI